MQFNEIYEKTKYAFEHDEVYALLTGKNGYDYQAPQFPFSVPTCDEFVFCNGIYPYFTSSSTEKKEEILSKLICAFREMMSSNDEVMVWWAFSLLHGQKEHEDYFKKAPFKISDFLLEEIKSTLVFNKQKLESNNSYLGCNHANGLWGEVERISRLLYADYKISVLNGER